jgi:NTP pyrophosphatase (non-canonical NTP hydrolase)
MSASGSFPEPGYDRIAEAIGVTLDAALVEIEVWQDGRRVEHGIDLVARLLDKAGLIDWNAFTTNSIQRQVWANKQRQGFNTSDVPLEVCLLQGEVAEFFDAWRRHRPDVREELADVAIYVFGLAEMIGVDLHTEITRKMATNADRRYELQNGVPAKVSDNPEVTR